jgi:hypothetical protein
MKSLITTLSAVAIGGFIATSAIAGPGDAYGAGFASRAFVTAKPVSVALYRSAEQTSDARIAAQPRKLVSVPNVNPKIAGGVPTATGYRY